MMSFGAAISTCFRKYATFSGRARRPEYWYFFLLMTVLGIGVGALDAGQGLRPGEIGPFEAIFTLATFLPGLAVAWRRMHDIGKPGYYLLLLLLAWILCVMLAVAGGPLTILGGIGILVITILSIVWMVSRSQPHDNVYGPEPDPRTGRQVASAG